MEKRCRERRLPDTALTTAHGRAVLEAQPSTRRDISNSLTEQEAGKWNAHAPGLVVERRLSPGRTCLCSGWTVSESSWREPGPAR